MGHWDAWVLRGVLMGTFWFSVGCLYDVRTAAFSMRFLWGHLGLLWGLYGAPKCLGPPWGPCGDAWVFCGVLVGYQDICIL